MPHNLERSTIEHHIDNSLTHTIKSLLEFGFTSILSHQLFGVDLCLYTILILVGRILFKIASSNHSNFEDKFLSPEFLDIDMSDINPIMTAQSALPYYEGKTTDQVFKDANLLYKLPHTQTEPAQFETQQNVYAVSERFSCCDPLNCHDMKAFSYFSDLIIKKQDPLDSEIMDVMKEMSDLNLNDKRLLLNNYRLLVKVCGTDWEYLKNSPKDASLLSYNAFSTAISSMIRVYQLKHSKAFNENITILGESTDNLKVTTRRLKEQIKMDNQYGTDLTQQLNHLGSRLAEFMEKMDSRILYLSHPVAKYSRAPPSLAPTVNSDSLPQGDLPGMTEPIPSTRFTSKYLQVSFDANLHVTASPTTSLGTPLAQLCLLDMNPKVLVNLLNRDLDVVISRINTRNGFFNEYRSTNVRELKGRLLKELLGGVKYAGDQWLRFLKTPLSIPQHTDQE